jgi:hypothetical protein
LLTGTGEAGATITFTDTVSGVSTVLGSTTVDSTGVWSYQATSITSGSHSITARQTDMAGNLSSASSAYTFTVDSTLMGLPALTAASDSGTLSSGWQAAGTWTPAANFAPTVVSVSPTSGIGPSRTFTVVVADANGAADPCGPDDREAMRL